jgi:endonuclease YncB( thermonuclease family)
MSKIFVNENPQAPADPAPVVVQPVAVQPVLVQRTVVHPAVFRAAVIQPAVVQPPGDVAQDVAKAIAMLFALGIACGAGLLLYHYWKSVLLVLLAIVVFAWWSTRGASIGSIFVLLVVLAILGKSAGAQTVTDGDTIELNGTTCRLWGIDAPESKQLCSGRPMGGVATEALKSLMRGKTGTCERGAHEG